MEIPEWTPELPSLTTSGFVVGFALTWGRPPLCCVCCRPLRPGRMVRWHGPPPDGLAHFGCGQAAGLPPWTVEDAERWGERWFADPAEAAAV
ncbi:MAG: hypothetical protein IMX02_01695 [Limnochordaceae bacterium]|nr:hypothetical protein [Limnochordaceae bacterium]